MVAVRSSAAGTTRLIMPISSAGLASIVSPKNRSSRARLSPTNHGIAISGPMWEKRTSGSPNFASSAAMVRSHINASSQAPPSTWPCTEAITGLFSDQGARPKSRLRCSVASHTFGSAAPLSAPRSGEWPMSRPAEKLRPLARSTTTVVAGSSSAREGGDDLLLHGRADGVELVGAIERDDADLLVGLVEDELLGHGVPQF